MNPRRRQTKALFYKWITVTNDRGDNDQQAELQFTRLVNIKHKRGGEGVYGARLEGIQSAILTLPRDGDSLKITSAWWLKIEGIHWDVAEIPDATEDGHHLDFLISTRGLDD